MKKSDKIFIAGHNGLVGSSVFKLLKKEGFKNLITTGLLGKEITHTDNTKSASKNILLIPEGINEELNKFIQVCPIEMLDKLDNPISLKQIKSKSA